MSDVVHTSSITFVLVSLALVTHFAGMIDAWATYKELIRLAYANRPYLRVLAIGGMRTAFIRMIQQVSLLYITIHASNTKVFYAVVLISVLSVVKEAWSAYDRHRSHDLWRQFTTTTIRRAEDL